MRKTVVLTIVCCSLFPTLALTRGLKADAERYDIRVGVSALDEYTILNGELKSMQIKTRGCSKFGTNEEAILYIYSMNDMVLQFKDRDYECQIVDIKRNPAKEMERDY